ncbi:9406_t:CDS:2 [Ambispora leptoticha]|uniref:mRNA 3'-end-processing protein n=1 Tax=Ambispora leptoticha TaxID=144679 RepID=A0A9N9FCP2_9GLOM|nr:9406_t:CDS:2 [Ambispora leptoticha]
MPGADVLFAPDYTSVSFDFEDFVREELGLGLHGPDQICQAYLRGNCHKGSKCEFKHTNSAREKAVVCKHWLRGLCKKGDQCEFLHEFNMRKMPECWFYSRYGECSNEDCMYLHIDPESKIKECAWYARGFCKHGPNCRHKHVRKVVCQLYLTGFCPKGLNCPNGHPKYELPVTRGDYDGASELDNHKSNENNAEENQRPQNHHGHRPLSEVTCFKCGQKGHFANRCPNGGGGGGGKQILIEKRLRKRFAATSFKKRNNFEMSF